MIEMAIPHGVQDCSLIINSYLNPWDQASYACASRDSNEMVKISLSDCAEEIRRLDGTYVQQLTLKQPLEDTPEGKIELVKRVIPQAIAYVRENHKFLEGVHY